MKTELKFEPAEAYKVDDGYLFPFTCLDDTPGDSNLGRIEWNLEFYKTKLDKGQRFVTQMLVWARQTRDPRYFGKTFLLDCNTAGVMSSCNRGRKTDDFMHCSWFVAPCPEHKGQIIAAYPEDHHNALHIEMNSWVGTYIKFVQEA